MLDIDNCKYCRTTGGTPLVGMDTKYGKFFVVCIRCLTQGPMMDTKEEAAAAWNLLNDEDARAWIAVADKLPKVAEKVIVHHGTFPGGDVCQGIWLGDGWWKIPGTRTKKVTHWREFPRAPKKETEEEV